MGKETNHKIFTFDRVIIFFKHTDYYGFVHSYNYLEWMSYAREAYFQKLVPSFMELCNGAIKMVTMEVEWEALGDAVFGDSVTIQIYSEFVKRLSFDVVFKFINLKTGVILGCGRQRLTFLDGTTGRPSKIPEELKQVVLLYEKKQFV